MSVAHSPLTVAVHALEEGSHDALRVDIQRGLGGRPKRLSPRWFYDERGSQLFEEITRLPEYYQTRTEAALLARHADDIVAGTRPQTLVEIGAGSCTKTRAIIEAARRAGTLQRFVPFDVSGTALREAARRLIDDYPGLLVHAVVGDFDEHLLEIPRFDQQLIMFLGSTIGNFDDDQRRRFLAGIRRLLAPGDWLLLGVDLVKSGRVLEAAYNDSQGVTAAFNRNVLSVINQELGARFDLDDFEHVARFDETGSRMELSLRARRALTVPIPGAGLDARFEKGETVLTEISVKFTREVVERELGQAGMSVSAWHADQEHPFAVVLAGPCI